MVSASHYLRTSYPDGDREYIDGAVVERNVGDADHSTLLGRVCAHLSAHEQALGLEVLPACRLRVSAERYRVPDITVMRRPYRTEAGALIDTPFLIVEIAASKDTFTQTWQRFTEYEALGVPHIVMLIAEDSDCWVFSEGALRHRELEGLELPGGGLLPFRGCAISRG